MNGLIIIGVAYVLVFAGLYAMQKKFARAFFETTLLFTVASSIVGLIVYQDVIDLKENILSEPKLFVMEDDTAVAAFTVTDLEKDMPIFLDKDSLVEVNNGLEQQLYESDESPYYKTFIISQDALMEQLPSTMQFDTVQFSHADVIATLDSETPRVYFVQKVAPEIIVAYELLPPEKKSEYLSMLGTAEQFKGQVFAVAFSAAIQDKGPIIIMRMLHDGTMKVVPETIAFRFIKLIPTSVVERYASVAQARLA